MVRAVLRDPQVRSALAAGALIAACAWATAGRHAWAFGVLGAVWLVATARYVRDAVRSAQAGGGADPGGALEADAPEAVVPETDGAAADVGVADGYAAPAAPVSRAEASSDVTSRDEAAPADATSSDDDRRR
jgi:hypothetical protein